MSVKNIGKIFRSAAKIVNKKPAPTPAAASSSGSSAKDLALKKYVSGIGTSSSKSIREKLRGYKAPESDSSSLSSHKRIGDVAAFGNLTLLSAADNEDSVKQLSGEMSSCFHDNADDPNLDSDVSPGLLNDSVGFYGNVMVSHWKPCHPHIDVRRKESTKKRKTQWINKGGQAKRIDQLVKMCGQVIGPNGTIHVLTKLGRATGLKEFNALIQLCIETARKTDDEEVSLNQIFVAYKIFEVMKERGLQIGVNSYGPFLQYLIDFGLVQEFHFFCDLIRDKSLCPNLAYYEMLLWIRVEDDEKIQELCYNLALYDGEDKPAFQQSYLLAFFDGDRKEEFLHLLETFDIIEVPSMDHLARIFTSLGKLCLDSVAERFLLSLRVNDVGIDHISRFIYDYAVGNPNLAVEGVSFAFQNLHSTLEVVPTSKSYEKLIRYCCALLKVHCALDVVDEMFEAGLTLSTETFHSLLDACEDSKEYHLVRPIYSMISSHELKPTTETFRRMINLCVRMKDYESAYGMVADLEKFNLMPTSNMYNAIMAGFFREKNIKGVVLVLKQMEDTNVKPDAQTYSYLLTNCNSEENIAKILEQMEQSRVPLTKHVYMGLINAYAACGLFDKAKQVVSDKRIPNLNEVKSVLVSALASHGQISDALDVFAEIKQAECDLEPKAAVTLIEYLGSEGELPRLLQILKELKKSNFWVDGCFRVILYCVRHKHLSATIDLLKQLVDRGNMDGESGGNIFDEPFFQFAESEPSEMQFGMDLLQAIKKEFDVLPSRKALDFLLSASICAKDLKSCFIIWNEYKAAGLPYNVLSYVRMYQVLLALGDYKSAERILDKISTDDYHVKLVIQACQALYMETMPPVKKKKKKK